MPVIAIINRKGGSGKSTLATHIAAWLAQQGCAVMLGDVDRQQSTKSWLRLRSPALPAIASWSVEQGNTLRVPTGITHVVLDTPGGMHGLELARTVMMLDAILMPICDSVFDRESAQIGLAELQTLPRVASGRCRLAAVGMRLDARTRSAAALQQWANALGIAYLGSLRDTQNYVRSVDRGMTIFDLSASMGATDRAQWQPILQWLQPIMWPSVPQKAAERDVQQPHAPGAKRLWAASPVLQRAREQRAQAASVVQPAAEPGSEEAQDGGPIPSFLRKAL